MGLSLLGYQPWTEPLRGPWAAPWAIGRTALLLVFRRKLFWGLYLLALLNFVVFGSGIYLLAQIDIAGLLETIKSDTAKKPNALVVAGIRMVGPGELQGFIHQLREGLHLAGTGETYRNFFWLQGYIVMAVMALAGSLMVGNDFLHGSIPFYLAKPVSRWHYLGGKVLAVAVFVNLLTTLPALLLFAECLLFEGGAYWEEQGHLLWGILAYGALLTVVLSLLVVGLAAGLKKTVPLILVWVSLLLFARFLATALVDGLGYPSQWRLIDLWNNLYILGAECLGTVPKLETNRQWKIRPQPAVWQAATVLSLVVLACLADLRRRIRAVEVVT